MRLCDCPKNPKVCFARDNFILPRRLLLFPLFAFLLVLLGLDLLRILILPLHLCQAHWFTFDTLIHLRVAS